MSAVLKPTSPSTAELLDAAQGYDGQGPGKLIRSYIHALRQLFQAEAATTFNVRQWQALERRLVIQHQHEWQRARADWGSEATAARLMNLAIDLGDAIASLIAATSAQGDRAGAWHEAAVELSHNAGTWEQHTDPTYAAFGFYTAVGWMGLRHAMQVGVRPALLEALLTGQPLGDAGPVQVAPRDRATHGFQQAVKAVDEVLSPVLASIVSRTQAAVASYQETQQERKEQEARTQAIRATLAAERAEQIRVRVAASPVAPPSQEPERHASTAFPLPLDGRRLRGSILPTWLMLVGLSWVSLIWGALISLPFGVGLVIFASMFAGFFTVPLWGTVWGFFGMGAARDSTLRQMGFQELEATHDLARTAATYARVLDIPTPRLGTMDVRNAFAMGTNRDDATVAIGRPLINTMRADEVNAILGHELGHVVSGDMRKMMLMRTFQNATVWFGIAQGVKQFARWVICWGAELAILAFSRKREYWADAVGAALAGKEAMIGALRKLQQEPAALTGGEVTHARFMFRGTLSTHPTMAQRIAALENETYIKRLPVRATGR